MRRLSIMLSAVALTAGLTAPAALAGERTDDSGQATLTGWAVPKTDAVVEVPVVRPSSSW